MLVALIASIVTAAVLACAPRYLAAAWVERGIATWKVTPNVLGVLVSVPAVAISYWIAHRVGVPEVMPATTAALWLGLYGLNTDLGCKKIPWELPYAAAPFGLASLITAFIAGPFTADKLTLNLLVFNFAASITLLVLAPLFARRILVPLITGRGPRKDAALGSGDIRMLWAFVCTTSWWLGYELSAIALILACMLQWPVHATVYVRARAKARRDAAAAGNPPAKIAKLRLAFAPAIVIANIAIMVYFACAVV